MFERILVPVDGSPGAERAIPAAARIARAFSSSIILLNVVTPPISPGKYSVPEEYPKADIDEELAEATNYLHKIAQSVELGIITTEVHTLVGAVAPTILSCTQSLHADLIIMCTHGHTGFKRWRLGSVAEKVIRHAPIPVFVLPEIGPEPAAADQQAVHALVALDGSPISEAMLEPAASLTALHHKASGSLNLAGIKG